MSLKTTRISGNPPCPKCGMIADAATSVEAGDHSPSLGDVGVCIQCGSVNIYNEDLSLRAATPEEIARFPAGIKATLANASATLALLHAKLGKRH